MREGDVTKNSGGRLAWGYASPFLSREEKEVGLEEDVLD